MSFEKNLPAVPRGPRLSLVCQGKKHMRCASPYWSLMNRSRIASVGSWETRIDPDRQELAWGRKNIMTVCNFYLSLA
jgi:hypothetical protein